MLDIISSWIETQLKVQGGKQRCRYSILTVWTLLIRQIVYFSRVNILPLISAVETQNEVPIEILVNVGSEIGITTNGIWSVLFNP